MDTWATSSLTPQIAGGWEDPGAGDLWGRVFPMDLRPQAHDIIRTWLFSTIVRSHLEQGTLPWANAVISGWILDPDRKKMSKSVGNVVTPKDLLDTHGPDAVRYWAASGRPGVDTAFDESQMEVGRKLSVKLLNASRFVLSPALWEIPPGGAGATGAAGAGARPDGPGPVGPLRPGEAALLAADAAKHPELAREPVDRALLATLDQLVAVSTNAFEGYDYARALERTEAWFWEFCDHYLELVKSRAYGEMGIERAASARAALASGLSAVLRLFAPFLPFVTEEVWSWWQRGSVHRAAWPGSPGERGERAEPGEPDMGGDAVYRAAITLLGEVRRAKSEARVGPRSPVERVAVRAPSEEITALRLVEGDLRAAQNIAELELSAGELRAIDVTLAGRPAT
jgi:valyl-tRNA synthetase